MYFFKRPLQTKKNALHGCHFRLWPSVSAWTDGQIFLKFKAGDFYWNCWQPWY